MNSFGMTKGERDALLSLVKKRERVLKTAAEQREAEMISEFEAQVSAIHGWDTEEVFRQVVETGNAEIKRLNEVVDARCDELGIPKEFRPKLYITWDARGESGFRERRAELRRKAKAHAAKVRAQADTKIEAMALAAQTDLLSTGLTSDTAKTFLASLSDIKDLMPAPSADDAREAAKQIAARRRDLQ